MIDKPMEKTILIENRLEELGKINEMLKGACRDFGLPDALFPSLNLALEEALTNIINYAYDDNLKHTIKVTLRRSKEKISIKICDDGKAFDPTKISAPDISRSVAERQIGGLGVFLIRNVMDEVNYTRQNDKNILTMIKSI